MTSTSDATTSLARSNLKDQVAIQIRQQIFEGELVPGTRVDQEALAERWGISKLPIREALISLEAEGLVTIVPRRGSFIAPLTAQEIRNHYEVFALVSGFAARLAATALSDDDLVSLRQIVDQMRVSNDPHDHEKLNLRFHQIINRATGSARVTAVLRLLSNSQPRDFFTITPGWQKEALAQHEAILDSMVRRDADAAEEAVLAHVRAGGRRAAEVLQTIWDRPRTAPDDLRRA